MENNDSLVSIITPNYNCASFIGQAIESVLSQTYRNWEMLIIDDCSTDDSVSIIKDYLEKDERIKLFSTEKNEKNPATPRNIGIKNAQGRYIAFLDSDDIYFSKKLENQIKLFNNDNIAIVFSNYEKMTEEGIRKNRIISLPCSVTYKKLLKGNCISNLTPIYDTVKIGKCYYQAVNHEDFVYLLSILRLGYTAINTNTVEGIVRIRKNSISANKLNAVKWTWNIYRNILKLTLIQSIYFYCCYIIGAIKRFIT
jgi:glycosyltransferase involved in cell wall biosynthesis